jgi:O-antigen/teichoic acid export membrane protein
MVELLQRLAKLVVGYGAVQWAGPFISLLFTPIVTRAVDPGDYGVAEYILTILSAISTVALLALPQAINTHFNDRPDDRDWQRRVTGSALAITIASGLLAGAAIVVFAPSIAGGSAELSANVWLLQLSGALMVFGMSAVVLTGAAQAALRVRWGIVFSLTSILSTVLGNILFIVILDLGVVGLIFTPIAAGLSLFVASLLLTRPMIGRPQFPVMRLLLAAGLILLPTTGASWMLQLSDRLFLGRLVSPTELGYYAIANKMASMVNVAMAPIYSAWMPLALAVQHKPGSYDRYISISRYLIAAVLAASLGIGLFATELLIVLTRPEYYPASPYVGFLTYMYVFGGFNAILTTGAMMGKRLGSISSAVVVGAVVNLVLNAVLIPRYGIAGATVATVIGYAVPQIVLYSLLQRRFPIAYPVGRILGVLGVQFGLMLVGLFVPALHFPLRVSIKLLLFSLLPVAYLVFGLIRPSELAQAGALVSSQVRGRFMRP